MDYKELLNKSISGLEELLLEKKDLVRSLRFKASSNQLKKTSSIREEKKDIARILTAVKALKNNKK
ncbi:MAG: 50S ribosomal protein L29 [Candidatus Magasanikbacteria bacterium]